jgi:8-oxo-dGTP diphosphatase
VTPARATNWVAVVAGFAVRDGRVLLAQRPPGKHLAGYWEFPGGKLEPGESAEEALARELREELDAGCRVGLLLDAVTHTYERFDLLMLLYHVTFTGEPRAHEASAVGWFTPAEIAALALPPADVPLLARLPAYLRRIEAARG